MGLSDRCSAGTPAGSPGPRSWPVRVSRTRGPGHSWLPRRPRNLSRRTRVHRRGPVRPGGPPGAGGPRGGPGARGHGGYTSPTRMRPMQSGRLGARWAAAGRTAGGSKAGCRLASQSGVLPSLLPSGAGRLQRGGGEFVGLVLRASMSSPSSHRASSTSESGGRPTHDARSP